MFSLLINPLISSWVLFLYQVYFQEYAASCILQCESSYKPYACTLKYECNISNKTFIEVELFFLIKYSVMTIEIVFCFTNHNITLVDFDDVNDKGQHMPQCCSGILVISVILYYKCRAVKRGI